MAHRLARCAPGAAYNCYPLDARPRNRVPCVVEVRTVTHAVREQRGVRRIGSTDRFLNLWATNGEHSWLRSPREGCMETEAGVSSADYRQAHIPSGARACPRTARRYMAPGALQRSRPASRSRRHLPLHTRTTAPTQHHDRIGTN